MLDPSLLSVPIPGTLVPPFVPSLSREEPRYLPDGWGGDRDRRKGMQGNLGSAEDDARTTQKPIKGRASEGFDKIRGGIT